MQHLISIVECRAKIYFRTRSSYSQDLVRARLKYCRVHGSGRYRKLHSNFPGVAELVEMLGRSGCEDAVVVEERHVDPVVGDVEHCCSVEGAEVPECQARSPAAHLD